MGQTAISLATRNDRAWAFQMLIKLPREHPINWYYDDMEADEILKDKDRVMRRHLIDLGLTWRFEDLDIKERPEGSD